MSSLKMTFSLTSLIFLIALGMVFVPTSVMAHIEDPADAAHDATDGNIHSVVTSLTIDKENLGENDILTVVVTYAPAHPAVTTAGSEDHGVSVPTAFALTDLSFTDSNDGNAANRFTAIGTATNTRVAADGVGPIWTIRLVTNALADNGTDDGTITVGVTAGSGYTNPMNDAGTKMVTLDSQAPTISNISFTATPYPQDDVFSTAFMVEFEAMDSGSGLGSVNDFMLTADPANVTFGDIKKSGSNKFTAMATPVATMTADAAAVDITITATVVDKVGISSDDAAATSMATVMLKRPAASTTTPTTPTTPTPTELGAMKTGLSVDAGKFILLVRSRANVKGLPDTLPDGAMIVEWESMPDLEALLYGGGSIDLTRAKTPQLDHDAKADTDARDAGARDLIITEVMWAKNTALTGMAGELDHQWIEIYNPLKANVGGVTITTTKKREFQTIADTDVLLDRLSNQVGAGWAFSGLGQNGSNDYNADTDDVKSNFISMFRNNRGKEGWTKAHWSPSTETSIAGHKGTPGRLEREAAVVITATSVPRSPFVINEFGIGNSDGEDWVELRNVTDAEASLKNLLLTSVTGLDKEEIEFHFHDKDLKVPAKGVVLVASTNPVDTDIAAGRNLEVAVDDQEKTGTTSLYVVRSFELPTGKFNLILRKDFNNKFDADFKGKALDKVIDAVGSLKVDKDTADFNTDFWPLNGTGAPHGDVIEGLGQDFKAGTVYIRKNAGGGTGEHHLGKVGYSGIGYDRIAAKSDANGGTPGFANDASKDKMAGLTTGEITISEIMVDVGGGRQSLPQWIELYNSSMTQAVNLSGWKLQIENAAKANGEPETNTFYATITLGSITISPNQTVLIASSTGRVSDPDHFPRTRVVNLWTTKAHRDALEMMRRTDPVLSTTGFNITLADKDGVTADSAGNLDGDRRTRDEPAWMLPVSEEDGRRSSLIRVYDDGVAIDGMTEAGWVSADTTNQAFSNSQTYYGDEDDFGTPGFRGGGPLPVSLSKFRPERMKDTGEIVVRWITESELNNAGFNILRSEKRDGEFTKVHFEAGQGTTSERTAYEWSDKSAKPNVVYYYQIQDVSLDGDVTTLRTTHLRGNVTATGKLTTTWGEIKALR